MADNHTNDSKSVYKWPISCLLIVGLVVVVGLYFTWPILFPSSGTQEESSSQNLPIDSTINSNESKLRQLTSGEQQQDVRSAASLASSYVELPKLSTPQSAEPTIVGDPSQSTPSIVNSEPTKDGSVASEQATNGASSLAAPVALDQTAQVMANIETGELDAWRNFKATYNKSYPNDEIELERRKIYNNNNMFITQFNEKSGAMFKLGVNQFADLTPDEINQRFIGPQMRWTDIKSRLSTPIPTYPLTQTNSIDWRNTMREPFDQGECPQSAVHAAISLIESRSKSGDTAYTVSPSQLHDCIANTMLRPHCSGLVSLDEVFSYLTRSRLPQVLYDEPTYREERGKGPQCWCNGCSDPVPTRPTMKPSDFAVVHQESIADALTNSGPLGIALDASQSTFHFYKSGLYHDLNCSSDNVNYFAVLVGFSPADRGNQQLPSFMVRNNFGPNWGETGHIRLLKDENYNKCLPQHAAIYPVID